MVDLSKIQKTTDYQLDENEDFNASDFVDLSEILLGKNIYARKLHDKIQYIIGRQEIRKGDIKKVLKQSLTDRKASKSFGMESLTN